MKPQTDLTTNFLLVNFPLSIPHTATKQSGTGRRGLDSVSEEASPISSSAMRNPPGRHLLKVASRAVRSSSGTSGLGGGGASTSASSPVSASSGGRPRGGGRLLRATSPPPLSAVAAAACWESRNLRRDGEDDWEEVVATGESPAPGASEAEEENDYRVVFWSPPTGDEVRSAFSSIQEVFENSYGAADSDETEKQLALLSTSVHSSSSNSSGSDDWVEPAAYVLNSTAFLTREHRGVLDAFRLLQRDPNVQKMVMSLSCDKAVWNAVMKNEAVQEFRKSFQDAKEIGRKGNPGGPAAVLRWILGKTQAKIMEFFDNVMKIVSMLFNPQSDEEKPDMYSEAVKVSFMLSVFVFIVVAIARINYEPWDFKVW